MKSLEIKETLGNEHDAAASYHHLGIVAQNQRDFDAAEAWYRKCVAIWEKLGDAYNAATSYAQLGTLARLQERWEDSARWLVKSIAAFARFNDLHYAHQAAYDFLVTYNLAPPSEQPKLRAIWRDAGLGEFPTGDPDSTP